MASVGKRAVAGSYDGNKGVFADGYVPTLFAWKNSTAIIYTKVEAPTTSDKALIGASTGLSEGTITAVGTGASSITVSATEYERYSDGDVAIN
jgi:hypothetical protein